jgi:hypothetical protein
MRLDLDRVAAYEPEALDVEEAEQAAVLVPVIRREAGDLLLFTERSKDLSDHAGEMSFPGGGGEPADLDREATALREHRLPAGMPAAGVTADSGRDCRESLEQPIAGTTGVGRTAGRIIKGNVIPPQRLSILK